jgi:hypothetical protein
MKRSKTGGLVACIAAVLASVLWISGCAGAGGGESTPSAATEKQVASVIAKHETEWRDVIETAATCHAQYAGNPGSLAADDCYKAEVKMGMTTEQAVQELNGLTIPSSMTSLVDDTTSILTEIGGVGLIAACGAQPNVDSDKCLTVIQQLNGYYPELSSELDAWDPYM